MGRTGGLFRLDGGQRTEKLEHIRFELLRLFLINFQIERPERFLTFQRGRDQFADRLVGIAEGNALADQILQKIGREKRVIQKQKRRRFRFEFDRF